jgi:3',5'-nucleoside bisphosphate phosphatase
MKHGYVKDWSSALELIRDAGYREMKADMAQTVKAVRRVGGVKLIAYPGRGKREPQEFTYYTPELFDQVCAELSLDGIKVYYPTHSPEMIESYLAYVEQQELTAECRLGFARPS